MTGAANRGGRFSEAWRDVMVEVPETGFDIAPGLHGLLRDQADLVAAEKLHRRRLHDVRLPRRAYPIAADSVRPGSGCGAAGTAWSAMSTPHRR